MDISKYLNKHRYVLYDTLSKNNFSQFNSLFLRDQQLQDAIAELAKEISVKYINIWYLTGQKLLIITIIIISS